MNTNRAQKMKSICPQKPGPRGALGFSDQIIRNMLVSIMMAEMRGVYQHEPTILAPTGRGNKYCPTFPSPATMINIIIILMITMIKKLSR